MKIGKYDIYPVETGRFVLDGGSMFGIIPKTLWSKSYPSDDENRIEMALRALLIKGDGHNILVDTGFGNKISDKQRKIFKIDYGKYNPESSLRKLDLEAKDITDVILTHLHFDHAGGSTYKEGDEHKPVFQEAVHYVQKTHYEWALEPSEKDKGSFHEEDFMPVAEEGNLRLVEGQAMILPDIDVIISDGHTKGQQLVKISDEENTLLFCGDLIPTAAHVHLPYIAGYDNFPLTTIEEKESILSKACYGDWTLFFEHDPLIEAAKVKKTEKGFAISEKVSL